MNAEVRLGHGYVVERVSLLPPGDAGRACMPTAVSKLLDDETVFTRTTLGQREVIFNHLPLPPMARRLLLLVNGETPLRTLLDLLQWQGEDAGDSILKLVDQGLIDIRVRRPA